MSSEPLPDPQTTTFNPSAWDIATLSEEERAVLDANYIKYPVAQNSPITFTSEVIAPTQPNDNNSTLVATTQFIQNFFNSVRTFPWTWSGTQTFSSLITTSLSSSSASISLATAFTPSYSYPLSSGQIGFQLTGTVATPLTYTINTPKLLATLDLSAGVFLLTGGGSRSSANGTLELWFTSDALNPRTNAQGLNSVITTNLSNALTTVHIITLSVATTFYMFGETSVLPSGGVFQGISFYATRIS
jgi:hypothetical protein